MGRIKYLTFSIDGVPMTSMLLTETERNQLRSEQDYLTFCLDNVLPIVNTVFKQYIVEHPGCNAKPLDKQWYLDNPHTVVVNAVNAEHPILSIPSNNVVSSDMLLYAHEYISARIKADQKKQGEMND